MPESKLVACLHALKRADVQFVLVGGLAAVLDGAPIQTYDIDIVYSRDPANMERLHAVLQSMDAIFRFQPARRLVPTMGHLAAGGHLNLVTQYGPLDLLGTVGNNLGYEELFASTTEMNIGEGIQIRVLTLEMLIAVKEQLAGEKDVAVLPILRRTLIELRKAREDSS